MRVKCRSQSDFEEVAASPWLQDWGLELPRLPEKFSEVFYVEVRVIQAFVLASQGDGKRHDLAL